MLVRLTVPLFALLLSALSDASVCPFPNNTDVGIHIFNCDLNHKITITDAKALDSDSNEIYPIEMKKPFILHLTAKNTGKIYNDYKIDFDLYDYKTGFLSDICVWKTVPTFGLLHNIDGCEKAKNCPLQVGELSLVLPLDLSSYDAIVVGLLDKYPYQLSLKIYDYNAGVEDHEEIGCVVVQTKIKC